MWLILPGKYSLIANSMSYIAPLHPADNIASGNGIIIP